MSAHLGTSFGPALTLVIGWDAAVARWVADKLEVEFGPCRAIGLAHDGKLIAGVVYNNHRPTTKDIDLSGYSESPLCWSRGFLRPIFKYPFSQLGCERVTAFTSVKNQSARTFLARIGFQQEGILRRAFTHGDDAVCYGMLREECRWLERGRNVYPAIPQAA